MGRKEHAWYLRTGVVGVAVAFFGLVAGYMYAIEKFGWAMVFIGLTAVCFGVIWCRLEEVLVPRTNQIDSIFVPSRKRQAVGIVLITLMSGWVVFLTNEKGIEKKNEAIRNQEKATDEWLIPGNEPTPQMPCVGYDSVHHTVVADANRPVPEDHLALFYGGSVSIQKLFPRIFLRVADIPRIIVDKNADGQIAVTLDIFDSSGKTLIARIEKNHFKLQPNGYFDSEFSSDKSRLNVTDKGGQRVLDIHYLNEKALVLDAILFYPGLSEPIVIEKDSLTVAEKKMYRNCFQDFGAGVPEIDVYPTKQPFGAITIPRPVSP
jgi:hypothetical protein